MCLLQQCFLSKPDSFSDGKQNVIKDLKGCRLSVTNMKELFWNFIQFSYLYIYKVMNTDLYTTIPAKRSTTTRTNPRKPKTCPQQDLFQVQQLF